MRGVSLPPAVCMLISAAGFALMGACVKLCSQRGIPLLEIVAARSLVSLLLSYADVYRKGISPLGQQRGLLIARGVVGTLALTCVYYAVTHMPFADATVLQYLHPMFTGILALFFLKEALTRSTLACVLLSLLGLLLMVRPGFIWGHEAASYPPLALAAALLGSIGSAVAYVLVRKLSVREDPSVIIFYFPLIALPISLLLPGEAFVLPTGFEWALLLAVGIFTQIGQLGLTWAMRQETAGRATGYSYLQVLFAALLGWWWFGEVPDSWVLPGASLIILAAFINLMGSRRPSAA